MKRALVAGGAFVAVLVLLALALRQRALEREVHQEATAPAVAPSTTRVAETYQGFLYGRITTVDGATLEGRLRWGEHGEQEAFWGDYFNGAKDENPWVALVPPERLPKERRPVEILGFRIAEREHPLDLRRPFMARFGDIARIEAHGKQVRVTLKSGTVFDLDRFDASDFDDGVRVWDGRRGGVDLDSLRIRTIELLPAPALGPVPDRLHGTVRTRHGEFTGFVQWDREACAGPDEFDGRSAEGTLRIRFDTIRSITRRSSDSSLVALLDGRELLLSGTRDAGRGNRGIYVDDRRYGRVLISWDAFERVDFSSGGSGPAYGDFPPGSPLTGSVTTRAGGRFTGRLVYDLDESETTETLDAPSGGVDYTIPFGLIASIEPEHGTVTLRTGENVQLASLGDLGEKNAGMLIFVDGGERPEYVPWADVARIDLDQAPATGSPAGGR